MARESRGLSMEKFAKGRQSNGKVVCLFQLYSNKIFIPLYRLRGKKCKSEQITIIYKCS